LKKKRERKSNSFQCGPVLSEKIEAAPPDQPPFDVMMIESMTYTLAKSRGLILPIRWENIPNMEKVFSSIKEMAPIKEGYGVVIGGEPIVTFYNQEKLPFKPTKWADMLRPELKGKIAIDKYYAVETLYMAAYYAWE